MRRLVAVTLLLLAGAMPAVAQEPLYVKGYGYAQAAPGANTDILSADVRPTEAVSAFRVTVQLATASVFKATVTDGTTGYDLVLNGGTAIPAARLHVFTFGVRSTLQYNFQVETDGVIQYLLIEELGGTVELAAPAQGNVLPSGASASQVQGTANDGAAEVGNPVQVGGVDGSGNAQALSTDTGGRADVNLVSGQSGITAGAGAVGASTPRVTHASDDPVTTAIQVIDDWDESDRAKVNLIVGQAGIAGGTGVDGASVPRVSLATNVPLPAGSNSIGTVDTELPAAAALADNAANPTAPTVGAALLAYDGATWDRVPNGGGVEAAALRVTVASDSTGVLSVDDNGSTLTVDAPAAAPVAVQLSDGAALQVAAALDTDTGVGTVTRIAMALAGAASGGPVAVEAGGGTEANALRVTVASDSTGVLSVDDNGASLTVDNAALSVTGGGVEATALRVTVASDSTGVLSVDDNGANLSVDWAGTVPPIGAGTEAAALRVTVATDSTGVLSVDDNGAALTVDSAQLPAALGQTTMAASLAVTIASNQSAVTTDTELPAAAALADNAANPTTPTVGAALLAYDGATWDRVQNGAGVAATALRTTLASDDPAVVALQIVDDWDETNRAAVNIIASQAGITGGAGAVAANTPRITLASDDPAVATLGATTGTAATTDANGTLQQYLRGLVVTSATGCSVDVNAAINADVDAAVGASTGLRLMGFSCRESAAGAAVATFQIVHGATVGAGTVIYVVELNPDESRSEWFGPRGIAVPNGISIDVVAGTLDVHPIYSDDVP